MSLSQVTHRNLSMSEEKIDLSSTARSAEKFTKFYDMLRIRAAITHFLFNADQFITLNSSLLFQDLLP